ncbi:1,4-dihydroxy-2-naphthoate octaprenyltransferase [Bacillus canaveralius]|uniref:1,4-dihydroxy-2-naphthoate octaprenyltransferase n=1 Tax=Bacillus canaveralius TaxID=1403243 RepID=A0A2N5GPF7_9BACI|nr:MULTISPECIES: 1,4-dihydroxy-2-naphthoate polyprenyltransferase [Bacillus]PLR84454.1 1,4-dihydroxy-2-naphthoate octaprenyltransferase [Bacillus canaveralius]PLR86961.1 1,4-dihydroxy-2-naphthoate octaprenyltransferase [Bacillus sp. V33-4]PLS00544.1 1,4-dihydroxy-2-naphthoate octaprenyltransferase [Bacillus canaveralius]RSK57829.1 1,4-dihydroxy-2-naphthoate polyprenyltransferase [Bacillus canaveralius]
MQSHMHTSPSPVASSQNWRVWWQLTRPHTLTAAFVPVLLGTALALQDTDIHIGLLAAMLIASLFIQAATNMFNEYYDYKRGLDNEESVGIGGAIVRHGISAKTVISLALGLYGLALLIGIYICMNSTWWLALIGLACMLAGYLYTGGPIPIAYTPFGELFAGLFMGIMIILISFYIQTGFISTISILVSIPIALLVGAILLANNIRDLDGDKENGRKTLAILLGRKRAIYLLAGKFIISFVWVFGLIVSAKASPWLALVVLSAPKAVEAIKGFIGKTVPLQMMPAMKATAQTNTIFGFLLSIGLFLSYFL